MYEDKLARGLFYDKTKNHGHSNTINKAIVNEVAENLSDPIAIFYSNKPNSIVALYDINSLNGNWVMIALEPKQNNRRIYINAITTIFARNDNSYYTNSIQSGMLVYYDDEKREKLAEHLLSESVSFSLLASSVLTKSDIINKNVRNNQNIILHKTGVLSFTSELDNLAAEFDYYDEFKISAILMFDLLYCRTACAYAMDFLSY